MLDIKGLRQEDSEIIMTTSWDMLKEAADCPIKISLKPKQLVRFTQGHMILFQVQESAEKMGPSEIDFVCFDFSVNDPI